MYLENCIHVSLCIRYTSILDIKRYYTMWVGSVNALRKSPIYSVAAALHIQPAKSLYGSKLPAAFCTACAFTWYNAR